MTITEFALKNSRLTILAILMITLAGIFTFLSYPSKEDPSIVIRNANVTAQFPGMSPERIEDLITRPLEEKIREIPEIKHIESDSKTGVSLIKVTIKDDVDNLNLVWQSLRDKMGDVAPTLPSGTQGPVVNDDVGLTSIATIAIWADGFSLSELQDIAEKTSDKLYQLDGVKKIERFGEQDERIYLEFSRSKMAQYGIAPSTIANTLKGQNIILPGGNLDAAGRTIILEPSGNFNSIEEIEKVLFSIPGTTQVAQLRDLVTVRREYIDPPKTPVYFNNHQAITLSVSINDGTNSVEFGENLKDKVDQIQQSLPWGYQLEFATFQPDLVDAAVNGAVNNLYQTLAIVLFVVMAFLGVRTGLIVGAFVPITMLLGILIMRFLDVELQRVSIAAMIIGLGMLVDNGIVIAEDIRVRLNKGIEKSKAAIEAGKSLAIPLLTSSLTTILFFVPMAMAEGGAGEFTMSLAQVITIVLLSSWFLSLFMTPAICVWFMKPDLNATPEENRFDGGFYKTYKSILQNILHFKYAFLAFMLVLLVGSGYALKFVGKEFFPLGDRNQFLVYLDLPAGSSITMTNEVTQRLTTWLSDESINPEISNNVAYIASGGPRFFLSLAAMDPDPHRSFIVVNTHNPETVDELVERTRGFIFDHLPEARGEAKKMWMGASEAGLFEVRVIGEDISELTETANALVKMLQDTPGTLIAKQNWENPVLKLNAEIDQARARTAGITSENVANALQTYFTGSTVTDFREGKNVLPIVLRSIEEERSTLTGLQAVNVYSSQNDNWVPLQQIAEIKGEWQEGRIKRRDQERTITVSSRHGSMSAEELYQVLIPKINKIQMSSGHRLEIGGEIEKQAEANSKLFASLPMCLGIIIALLVWQFNSFRRPAIIMLTIPLIIVGVTVGLLTMQALFGFMVILGLFSLAGIIINNGIVLIDRIDQARLEGATIHDAILDACLQRLRPILVTSLTTVLGLLPLIISQDPLFYAMACAMAFGLALGTILTLGVVPALYATFFPEKTVSVKGTS